MYTQVISNIVWACMHIKDSLTEVIVEVHDHSVSKMFLATQSTTLYVAVTSRKRT